MIPERPTSTWPPLSAEDITRFWSKVDRGDAAACWPWKAGACPLGYGKFQIGKHKAQTHLRAHRVAVFLDRGHFDGLVLHACDNPRCCNPAHLSIGTQLDNRRDCASKGRTAKGLGYRARPQIGVAHPKAIINDEIVREIRRRCAGGESPRSVATVIGVKVHLIYQVRSRITWSHVA